MSRVEDKLSASIKPAKTKTAAAKSGQAARPAPPVKRTAPAKEKAADPADTSARALHPRRIWPD